MNETVANFSIPFICEVCQTSLGFSSTDRRSIIVLVVLIGIVLISCYIGVLWFAIRTRYIPDEKLPIMPENVYENQAFDDNDGKEDLEGNMPTMEDPITAQPAIFTVENEVKHF